jgi:aminoglycoside phosphotransferase (APT) family kinase protein
MEGAYKSKLDERQLNEVVHKVMNSSIRSYSELSDGWANSAYSIELQDGRKIVLKARPPEGIRFMRCEVDLMKTEVESMQQLSSVGQLPIPRIYVHDASCEILPVEYFIMEYLEGKPYNQLKSDMPDEQREAIDRQLGAFNRLINEVKGPGFGFYSRPTDLSWRDAFAEMIYGVVEDGKDVGLSMPIPYEELEQLIERNLDHLDAVTEPRLLHWDLWDGNVFVKDGQVTGIIDFERAMWGDPLMEHYFSHFNPSDAFREGYGLFITEPSQIARRKLYDLYLDLILYVECTYRKYENEHHVKWTYENLVQSLERFGATE